MSNLSNPLRKCACRPIMTNCILWGNSTPKILDEEGAETTITFSNVEGGWTGSGGNNIDVDPLFVDAPDGNLRLLPNSPCIDAGDNGSVLESVTTDLDGKPRVIDGNLDGTVIVDMGAYESQPLTLDIDPGACPNVLNIGRGGPIKMAILGTPAFEVWELNLTSLALSRADGVGGTVQPVQRGRGRGIRFKDVATPFSGAPCECHDLRGDGIVDRVLTFSVREMVNAFELGALEPGMAVTLTLTGRLIDGTEFAASDCVVVNRRGRQ